MISRRDFLTTTAAASAASLIGCRSNTDNAAAKPPAAAPPPARTGLELAFFGGTVFVKDGKYVTAVQPSGYGQSYGGHSLEHQSFIVGPEKLFPTGIPFPALAASVLFKNIAAATGGTFKAICLVGKDITVSGTGARDTEFKCQQVVRYGHIAANWTRKGTWDPGAKQPVNSRFSLRNGEVVDGIPVNSNGAAVQWWVKDRTKEQTLSDVATLKLDADDITISGLLTTGDYAVPKGTTLPLMVFSGPLELHDPPYKYKTLTHALVLRTLYDVGTASEADIMPTTASEIDGMKGDSFDNPCGGMQKAVIPPDSEYCANYDELP